MFNIASKHVDKLKNRSFLRLLEGLMKASRKNGKTVERSIPWALHMAIVRLQGAEELEYDEACIRAAALIEEGGGNYREAVKAEANRIYKSRFMKEQNKAKKTWIQKGINMGHSEGLNKGVKMATDRLQISYPCAKCGKEMVLRPGEKDTKAAVEYLKSQGWRHGNCGEA
jgi:hypothetical protein